MGTGDDGYDEEGYDESQRAEILEATRDGPTDGTILTDLDPDVADDKDDDKLEMSSDEVGEEADDDDDADDATEDEVQAKFDDDTVTKDDLSDVDDAALRP
ncbi:MAG: DNA primase [Pseudomonadota bacterium]|nr:DNA primase [Pseudomonadota bacterium]